MLVVVGKFQLPIRVLCEDLVVARPQIRVHIGLRVGIETVVVAVVHDAVAVCIHVRDLGDLSLVIKGPSALACHLVEILDVREILQAVLIVEHAVRGGDRRQREISHREIAAAVYGQIVLIGIGPPRLIEIHVRHIVPVHVQTLQRVAAVRHHVVLDQLEGILIPGGNRFFHRARAVLIGLDEIAGHVRVEAVGDCQVPAVHRVVHALAGQLFHRDILLDIGVVAGDDDEVPSAKVVFRQIVRHRLASLNLRRFRGCFRLGRGRGIGIRVCSAIGIALFSAGGETSSQHGGKQYPCKQLLHFI